MHERSCLRDECPPIVAFRNDQSVVTPFVVSRQVNIRERATLVRKLYGRLTGVEADEGLCAPVVEESSAANALLSVEPGSELKPGGVIEEADEFKHRCCRVRIRPSALSDECLDIRTVRECHSCEFVEGRRLAQPAPPLDRRFSVVQNRRVKTCPYCSEEIQESALKCRWCGSDLTVSPGEVLANPPAQLASQRGDERKSGDSETTDGSRTDPP